MPEKSRAITNTEQRFYYADGNRVPLMPSSHYVALRSQAPDAASRVAAALAPASHSPMAVPPQVFDLKEHGLIVVQVANSVGARAATPTTPVLPEAVNALMSSQPDLDPGPSVYETNSPEPEGLIPIGEILVKFKPDVPADGKRNLLEEHHLEVLKTDYPEPGTDLVATKNEQDTIDVANRLHESALVDFAQPNFVHLAPRLSTLAVGYHGSPGFGVTAPPPVPAVEPGAMEALPFARPAVGPALAPNDPAYASQWNLVKIQAPSAWDISSGSAAIAIAIIDEGCDMTHEDIAYKLPGYDAFAADNDPQPNGNDAHGTACGGVAAMKVNNSTGGVGVAPACQVMPIRIAEGIGGGFWNTTDAKVADGIRKAVDAPRSADVLSNSYGLSPSTVVTNAFKYAQTNGRGGKGCPIAAAAGNANTPPVIYPANLSPTIPGFLAVSATNEWDQRKSTTSLDGETWWGSSFGPEVDVAAPGVHIYTADIMGGAGYAGGNYVPNFNGTSSATPHVAGLMALILSADPDLRSWEVEDIIKLTADDLGPGGRDPEFGFGRINCRRAL